MAIEAEALQALSEKAEPGEVFVDGDKLRLVAAPKGSTYIGDHVTIALCACGPKAMSNATLLAELWNGYRDGSLIHRSALAEDTARAAEGAIAEIARPKAQTARKALTWDEAIDLAQRAIYDTDGRGMIARNRNHLHERVAREILNATLALTKEAADANR